jgi:hypothetical protein
MPAGRPTANQSAANQARLRRLATERLVKERATKAGVSLCKFRSPGEMAMHHDKYVVQRPHLVKMDEMFQRILLGEKNRVMILTPPQVGKSMRVVWGTFWWMAKRPRSRPVVVSYGATLAGMRGRLLRNMVRDYGDDYGLYGDPQDFSAERWSLTSSGGLRTAGVTSGLTGTPSDFMVIDDPTKDRQEADSPTQQKVAWEFYSGTAIPRMAPTAPLLMITTAWSLKDLRGQILESEGRVEDGGRWTVIEMPALARENDPLGRKPGEPLWHPRIPEDDRVGALRHWEEVRSTVSARDWAALYQCSPIPLDGALVKEELWQKQSYSVIPDEALPARTTEVSIDPSGGGRDEAGIVGGFLGNDNRVYWTHDVSGVYGPGEWAKKACQLAFEIHADRFVFEKNYGGRMVDELLKTAWKDLGYNRVMPRIVAVHSKVGKELRAEPIAGQLEHDRIRVIGRLFDLRDEWCQWVPGSRWSPGRLDASVHMATDLLPTASPGKLLVPKGTLSQHSGNSSAAKKLGIPVIKGLPPSMR